MRVQEVTMGMVLLGCSTRFLPPPAAPRRVPPRVAHTPSPREGEGVVTLDVDRGHARVELITQRTQAEPLQSGWATSGRGATPYAPQAQFTLRPLCQTPCAVSLPRGTHELLFTDADPSTGRMSTAFVDVTETPSFVRHALGHQTSALGGLISGIMLGGVGFTLALAGGLLAAFHDASDPRRENLGLIGGSLGGVGLVMSVVGIVLGYSSRPELRPGATTQWAPSGP